MTRSQRANASSLPYIIILMAIAVAIRLVYFWVYRAMPDWSMLTVDNYYHHHWAQVIAGGDVVGDTTYFRAPLYVWCLSALYAVFGDGLITGRLFGLVVGLGSVFMTYRLGSRLVSPRAGFAAGLIHAVYPAAIYFDFELLLDPLFTLLLQVAMYRVLLWWERPTPWIFFSAGLWFGLASICRPTSLVWMLVCALIPLALLRWGVGIRRAAVFLAGAGLIIVPLTVRNIVVAGDPVLIASQGGINLYIGNNERADGLSAVLPEPLGHNWRIADVVHRAEKALGRDLTPGEVSGYWTDQAVQWMKDNPVSFLSLFARKLYYSISNREVSNNRDLAEFFSRVALLRYNPIEFGIVFALAIMGLILLWRHNKRARWLAAVLLAAVLSGALFFFASRFRLPLIPFLAVLAGAGITEAWRRRRSAIGLAPAMLIGICAGIVSYAPLVSLPEGSAVHRLMIRGSHLYAVDDFETARQLYAAALRQDDDFPEVNLNMGTAWLRLGRADSAEYYYRREIDKHPERAAGYANLASLMLIEGHADSARSAAGRSLSLRLYDPMASRIMVRAAAADSTLSLDSVVSIVRERARDTDNDIFVLNEAATLIAARGAYGVADSILRVALGAKRPPIEMDDSAFDRDFRNSPSNRRRALAESNFQLGFLAGIRGDLAGAIKYSREAIDLDSMRVEAYVNLARGYYQSGRLAVADSVMAEADRRFGAETLKRLVPGQPQ